jgi:murein DD-endopeptidase MepM/ murein hydrolase activator NlpD
LALTAAFTLAGCAVENIPYPRPEPSPIPSGPSYTPPPSQYDYTRVPRAEVQGELLACRNLGHNIGEIGFRGESLLYTPYIDTPAGALLRDPTEGACLSSGFGWRGTDTGGGRQHNGIDLANPNGGFIYAAADGRVIAAEYRAGFGNTVVIDYGRGVRSLYGHLSEIDPNLRPGDHVYSGQAVGRMGMTGNATGVHLHYEVTVDGLLVDPLNYGRPPVYVSAPQPQPLPIPDDAFTTPNAEESAPTESTPVEATPPDKPPY